jgi:carbon storage regulator
MLVLSRKEKQTIKIGDDVEVTVLRIQGNRVRLAISARREVPIRREELAPLPTTELQCPGALNLCGV